MWTQTRSNLRVRRKRPLLVHLIPTKTLNRKTRCSCCWGPVACSSNSRWAKHRRTGVRKRCHWKFIPILTSCWCISDGTSRYRVYYQCDSPFRALQDTTRCEHKNGRPVRKDSIGRWVHDKHLMHSTVAVSTWHWQITLGHEMVVAHIEAPVVIGMDFLETYQCVLDNGTHALINNGVVHICRSVESMPQVFRIRAADTVILSPMSEIIMLGEIPESPYVTQSIVEGDSKFVFDGYNFMARAVLNPAQGTFPLHVMNLGEEPQEVHKGTNVAICEPVASVGQPISGSNGVKVEDHCDLLIMCRVWSMTVKIFQPIRNLSLKVFFLVLLMILLVPNMISQSPRLISIVWLWCQKSESSYLASPIHDQKRKRLHTCIENARDNQERGDSTGTVIREMGDSADKMISVEKSDHQEKKKKKTEPEAAG